jgi:demethylspheroidene O-methyltransferase
LTSRVLDLPETVDLAAPFLAAAGMTGRITVEAHDYRTGPFPGPVDAALISNVLRGEAPPMIDDILRRVHGALKPGGHLIITDLFPEDPRPDIRLRAGLFGLHIPDGANYTLDQMADAARRAGFELLRSEYLTRCTVLNAIVEARRAD